jgi:hypothetical protein
MFKELIQSVLGVIPYASEVLKMKEPRLGVAQFIKW